MDSVKLKTLYEKFVQDGYVIAQNHCSGGYPDNENCAWYHGNWMLLRYLGAVSNPYWHEDFYRGAFDFINAKDKNLFLIVGTADFSMPLLCTEAGVQHIHICDICDTPLMVCNLVSDYLGVDWVTFKHNIYDKMPNRYDVIVNDAFLSRFVNKESALLGIADSLMPDGYYITTLKQGKDNKGGQISPRLKSSFMNRIRNRYNANTAIFPEIHIDDISSTYVDKMASYPVKDEHAVWQLFNQCGLEILKIECAQVVGEYEPSDYFRIISKKID